MRFSAGRRRRKKWWMVFHFISSDLNYSTIISFWSIHTSVCDYNCKVANAQKAQNPKIENGFRSRFCSALSRHCCEHVIAKQNWRCAQTKTFIVIAKITRLLLQIDKYVGSTVIQFLLHTSRAECSIHRM